MEVGLAPDDSRSLSRPLVQLAAEGDRDAFAQIVAENDADMFRLSVLITRDPEAARDAVQQAWSRAWAALRSLREESHLRAWLLSIAANEARSIARSQRATRARESAFVAARPTEQGADEAIVELEDALAKLSPDDRALVALRYVFGFNAHEIADQLHSTHGAIRSRLARLIQTLRHELGDA
jgi:RNA polymerase sigma-70 factor (ECF subfamily)